MILVFSFLLFLVGVAIGYFMFVLSREEILTKINISIGQGVENAFTLNELLTASCLILVAAFILMAMWGCSVTYLHTKWCLCPFSFIALIFFLIILSIGTALTIQTSLGGQEYL
jgi:Sec-independent protein secretion pathway component TatC